MPLWMSYACFVQSLSQLNSKLEEENRTLMMQLQALLNQNQEMLTQAMDSKDHFHEEERAYMWVKLSFQC